LKGLFSMSLPSLIRSGDFHPDADFSEVVKVGPRGLAQSAGKGSPNGVSLNVNVPKGKVRGIKVATQTPGKWVNEYYRTKDGVGREVFWMTASLITGIRITRRTTSGVS